MDDSPSSSPFPFLFWVTHTTCSRHTRPNTHLCQGSYGHKGTDSVHHVMGDIGTELNRLQIPRHAIRTTCFILFDFQAAARNGAKPGSAIRSGSPLLQILGCAALARFTFVDGPVSVTRSPEVRVDLVSALLAVDRRHSRHMLSTTVCRVWFMAATPSPPFSLSPFSSFGRHLRGARQRPRDEPATPDDGSEAQIVVDN